MNATETELQELTARVERALTSLRPYLEADGGDIELVEVTEELTARVKLHGACAECSMIHMTMKGGVEQAVRAAAPEIKAVEAINWAG
jgi:Fe-S cluster biogenesis protein NfuA